MMKNANTVPFIINELKIADAESPAGNESFHVARDDVTQWHDEGAGEAKYENTEYQKEGGGKKNAYILLVGRKCGGGARNGCVDCGIYCTPDVAPV